MATDLIIIRHAVARDRQRWADKGRRDSDRPLTEKGREHLKDQALGLSLLSGPIERVLTSPFTRCLQSAKILSAELAHGQSPLTLKALAVDSSPLKMVKELEKFDKGTIVVVGHEPELSNLTDLLLSPHYQRTWKQLKKGAAVKLTFSGAIQAGQARLNWHLMPKALRVLGRSFADSLPKAKKAGVPQKLQAVG